MERREALKNLGLSIGSISMSSAVVGILQSCSTGETWQPKFFSIDEANLVAKTLELILPVDPDVPGATELNLTLFIDGYIDQILKDSDKETIKVGIAQYLSSTLAATDRRNVDRITEDDVTKQLTFYLKADSDQQNVWDVENNS